MIIVGADVIGDSDISQHQFIGLVFGTEEAVNRLHNKIGLNKEIHMRELTEKQQNQVYQRIDFTDNEIEVWCLNVERQNIINAIKNHEHLNPKFKMGKKIQKHFDMLLLRKIRGQVEQFTLLHGKHINELTMECEGDMIMTAQNWNMGTQYKGKAYQLADAIVRCNQRRHRVNGCHGEDIRDELFDEMHHDLLK